MDPQWPSATRGEQEFSEAARCDWWPCQRAATVQLGPCGERWCSEHATKLQKEET